MWNIWTIAKREYKYYFGSPIAYVLAFLILVVIGAVFTVSLFLTMQVYGQIPPPGVQVVTMPLMFMLVFACPALTMRLLSEEQRMGTMELLLTAPLRDWELVIGKWLGSFLFLSTLVALTLLYPFALNLLVDPGIDKGPILSGYLGVLLVSGAFLGIGVFISSLFSNQVVSYIATFVVLIFSFWMFTIFTEASSPAVASVLRYLDISNHYYGIFNRGIIELGSVVYLLSVIALTLFLGSMSVEMRRWR